MTSGGASVRASRSCPLTLLAPAPRLRQALLPASFKALDNALGLGPSRLAALSFAQNVAFSLALPLWGSLLRYYSARDLMAATGPVGLRASFVGTCLGSDMGGLYETIALESRGGDSCHRGSDRVGLPSTAHCVAAPCCSRAPLWDRTPQLPHRGPDSRFRVPLAH